MYPYGYGILFHTTPSLQLNPHTSHFSANSTALWWRRCTRTLSSKVAYGEAIIFTTCWTPHGSTQPTISANQLFSRVSSQDGGQESHSEMRRNPGHFPIVSTHHVCFFCMKHTENQTQEPRLVLSAIDFALCEIAQNLCGVRMGCIQLHHKPSPPWEQIAISSTGNSNLKGV